MKILALDFETGGRSAERHAPVTLGVALMQGEEVLDSRHWLFAPPRHWKTGEVDREYDIGALKISGVTWKQITESGLPHAQVVKELREWSIANGSREELVVAYNAGFDRNFYDLTLFLASDWHPTIRGTKVPPKPPLLGPWDCAMRRAQDLLDLENFKLDTVAGYFGLSRAGETHGALEDAILAGQIYHRLCDLANQKKGAA